MGLAIRWIDPTAADIEDPRPDGVEMNSTYISWAISKTGASDWLFG